MVGVAHADTYTIQPWGGDSNGQATFYGSVYDPGPMYTSTSFSFGGWGDYYYDFYQFNLANAPAASITTDASLWVWTASAPVNNPAINVYQVTGSWNQTTLTRSLSPASTLFGAGPSSIAAGWNSSSITSLYQGWQNSTISNYGVEYVPTQNNNTAGGFDGFYDPIPTHHPRLVITTNSGTAVRTDSITPYTATNGGSVPISSITGNNFASGATVTLQMSGQANITCTGFTFVNSTSLTGGTCPITGAALGMWNLVVTNTDGSKGTLAPAFQVTASTYTIQPWGGDSNGQATFYGSVYDPGPMYTSTSFSFGGWGDYYYDFYQFNLANAPAASITTDASLWVWTASAPVNNPAINVYQVTGSWNQTTLTRSLSPASTLFGAGPSSIAAGWNSSSITSLYQGWQNSTISNYGVEYVPTQNNNTAGGFDAEYDSNPIDHPKLVITSGTGGIRVDSITPYSAPNSGSVSITSITGTNFAAGASVLLRMSGQTDITCTGFTVASSTSLTGGTCPITGVTSGLWNLVVTNSNGTQGTLAPAFQVGANPPTLTSPTATSITSSAATLGANVTLNGGAALTAVGTCWSTSSTAPITTNCLAIGATSTGVFTQSRTGITSGTTIYYNGYATNSAGTGYSPVGTFTTMVPTVVTSAASSVTPSTATLNGTGNPNLEAATGWFRYSTTNPGTCNDTFGTRVPASGGTSLGSGSSAVAFSQAVNSLTQVTTYYYCAIASNSVGTGFGSVASFTTAAIVAPTVTSPAGTVTDITGRLGANVTSDGGAGSLTAIGICWGTSPSPTTNCSPSGATTVGTFVEGVTGLPPSTLIYYRGYATNVAGTSYSSDGSLTTGSNPGVVASGGSVNVIGGRTIQTFVTSGTFTVTGVYGSGNVEVLVVGAGGGGGGSMGGGGGAGGLIYNNAFNVTPGAYTVTVGTGGTGGSGSSSNATNGGNSSFSTLSAVGGGAGGRYYAVS